MRWKCLSELTFEQGRRPPSGGRHPTRHTILLRSCHASASVIYRVPWNGRLTTCQTVRRMCVAKPARFTGCPASLVCLTNRKKSQEISTKSRNTCQFPANGISILATGWCSISRLDISMNSTKRSEASFAIKARTGDSGRYWKSKAPSMRGTPSARKGRLVRSKSGVRLKDSLSSRECAQVPDSRDSINTSEIVRPICAYADKASGKSLRTVSANSLNVTRGLRRCGVVVESR